MKNKEIIAHINGLNQMEEREKAEIERNKDYKRMNIKVVYRIMKNKQELTKAIETYNACLKELLSKYNARVEEGKIIPEDETKTMELLDEINDLLDIETDVEIGKLNLEDFGDCVISQADMDAMNFMIE